MIYKKIQNIVIHRQAAHFFRLLAENLDELFRRGEINLDLIWNTAKKCVIAKLSWLNVRREKDQLLKSLLQMFRTNDRRLDTLVLRSRDIVRQRDWRRARVLV